MLRNDNLAKLLAGHVNIKQWIKIEKDIPFAKAEYFFKLGVAIMTKDYAKAKDKLIPVRLGLGEYTWIIVEDKNNNDQDSHKNSVADTHAAPITFPDIKDASPQPYLILYCQFGDLQTQQNELVKSLFTYSPYMGKNYSISDEKTRKFVIGIFGLTPDTCGILNDIPLSDQERIVEQLNLLRDGSFKSGTYPYQNLKEFLLRLRVDMQRLHNIKIE